MQRYQPRPPQPQKSPSQSQRPTRIYQARGKADRIYQPRRQPFNLGSELTPLTDMIEIPSIAPFEDPLNHYATPYSHPSPFEEQFQSSSRVYVPPTKSTLDKRRSLALVRTMLKRKADYSRDPWMTFMSTASSRPLSLMTRMRTLPRPVSKASERRAQRLD